MHDTLLKYCPLDTSSPLTLGSQSVAGAHVANALGALHAPPPAPSREPRRFFSSPSPSPSPFPSPEGVPSREPRPILERRLDARDGLPSSARSATTTICGFQVAAEMRSSSFPPVASAHASSSSSSAS